MDNMEHPQSPTLPFGLLPEEIQICVEQSQLGRPKGMSSYEAFAFFIEALVADKIGRAHMGVMPMVRSYGRLRTQAEAMAKAIESGDSSACMQALGAYRFDLLPENRTDED